MPFNYWDMHPIIENPPVAVPLFIPTFQTVFETFTYPDGSSVKYPLNSAYFATITTAQWIANKFGDGHVYSVPFEGSGGPTSTSIMVYVTKLVKGLLVGLFVNCGILATYYQLIPEGLYPGIAEHQIDMQEGITANF